MILVSLALGVLCAMLLLLAMVHIFALAYMYISRDTRDKFSLKLLLTQPDGVETDIRLRDGLIVRSFHKGSGQVVILLHDIGWTSVSMNLLWKQLSARGFKVITYDQRAHGSSGHGQLPLNNKTLTRDLEEIIKAHNIEECTIISSGLSSYAALSASTIQSCVKSVYAIGDPAGTHVRSISEDRIFNWLHRSILGRAILSRKFYRRLMAGSYYGAIPSPNLLEAYLQLFSPEIYKHILPELDFGEIEELVTSASTKGNLYLWSGVESGSLRKYYPQALNKLQEKGHWLVNDFYHSPLLAWAQPHEIADFLNLTDQRRSIILN